LLTLLQAVYQPQGGILASELCIAAHIQAAQAHGAEFHAPEKVQTWKVDESTGVVTVFTDRQQYTARKLILTAGSWMPDILPELQVTFCSICWRQSKNHHKKTVIAPSPFAPAPLALHAM